MEAEFYILGRVARVTDLAEKQTGNAAYLISVATEENWKDRGEWQKRTSFHTLTVYRGFEDVRRGVGIGDLVRFKGDIRSWSRRDEDTQDYEQGVTLVAKERRIVQRKRAAEDGSPETEQDESDDVGGAQPPDMQQAGGAKSKAQAR